MPVYVYRCADCRWEVELRHAVDAEPPQRCAQCMGHLRRVFFPPAISFQGSGFHATDYRPGGGEEKAGT